MLPRWWGRSRLRRFERGSTEGSEQRLRLFERFGRSLRRRCALIRPLIRRVEIATAIATELPSSRLRRTLIGPAIVLIEVTVAIVAKLPPSGSSRRRSRCCHEADDQQEQRNPTSAYEPHVAPTFPERQATGAVQLDCRSHRRRLVRACNPIRCGILARTRYLNEHEATVSATRNCLM